MRNAPATRRKGTPGTATMLQFGAAFDEDVKLEGYNLGLFAPQGAETVPD